MIRSWRRLTARFEAKTGPQCLALAEFCGKEREPCVGRPCFLADVHVLELYTCRQLGERHTFADTRHELILRGTASQLRGPEYQSSHDGRQLFALQVRASQLSHHRREATQHPSSIATPTVLLFLFPVVPEQLTQAFEEFNVRMAFVVHQQRSFALRKDRRGVQQLYPAFGYVARGTL